MSESRFAKRDLLNANRACMLISCPDRPGIVAAVSRFLAEQGANIVQSDQYTMDPSGGMFFMRIEFDLDNLNGRLSVLEEAFRTATEPFHMSWRINRMNQKKRVAIFVSREDHCLLELLWQWQAGDLYMDAALIIGNHASMAEAAAPFGVPFYHVPVTPETKEEAERRQIELIQEHNVDLIILARYMQIVSPHFISKYRNRIINIHHSFLPAFVGGKPYAQAYERGVKIIGATAHYVTEDLDAGPIIEQDVQRVTHRDNVDDLKRIGRHIERIVLAKAVSWHLEDRILVHQNKTVIFN